MLNLTICKEYPNFIALHLSHSAIGSRQLQGYIDVLATALSEKFFFLKKDGLHNYLTAELNCYATLFPEFSKFNKAFLFLSNIFLYIVKLCLPVPGIAK